MGNPTRNGGELPCYMDLGSKLFPEAIEGNKLDLTDPRTRDQMLKKHIIRSHREKGMKPVKVWLYMHNDAVSGHSGIPSAATSTDGTNGQREDFYGDGGHRTIPDALGGAPIGSSDPNFYHENTERVYAGPFDMPVEYNPESAASLLSDLGVDRPVNDIFFFLKEDEKRILGRQMFEGDLIQRFDGKIMEVMTARDHQAENWEWLYTMCGAVNTNKDHRALFRE